MLDAGSILKPYLGNMANADVREFPKTLDRASEATAGCCDSPMAAMGAVNGTENTSG